jgi:hypothetical protein
MILDFIIKLPPSVELITEVVFDLILVIIDRLTKYGYFILYKESLLAENSHMPLISILSEITKFRKKLLIIEINFLRRDFRNY